MSHLQKVKEVRKLKFALLVRYSLALSWARKAKTFRLRKIIKTSYATIQIKSTEKTNLILSKHTKNIKSKKKLVTVGQH